MNLMINISRLHPLLVHLPIGIMFFALILFAIKKWKGESKYDSSIVLALFCSCATSILAVVTGYFLSQDGSYDVDILFWHKYLGSATCLGMLILFLLVKYGKIDSRISSLMFFIIIVLLILTGHNGGSLTHGSNYLFEKSSKRQNALHHISDINNIHVYKDLITPIIENKCISCHQASKTKGELLMINYQNLVKGGKSGSVFNFDEPKESELLKRILLPITDEDHMPPKGKVQLNNDEIILLEWWIENKACENCKVGALIPREDVKTILNRSLKPTNRINHHSISSPKDEYLKRLQNNGITITSISKSSPFISLGLPNNTEVSKKMIRSLKLVGENIKELNLSSVEINKDLLNTIVGLENLQSLQLQHSNISDNDINKLISLENLHTLNIYNTSISDESIEALSKIPALKKIFSWQSQISKAGANKLKTLNPNLEINQGVDASFFGKATLNPPAILADTDLFKDSLIVSLKNDSKNSIIHYTVDGSDPDSNAMVYNNPLRLLASQKIKSIARKKGWDNSSISSKQFIQLKDKIESIKLSKSASSKYPGEGPNTLIDLKKGTTDFRSTKWLGFEGTHISAVIKLNTVDNISGVYVSAFSDPGSWIFYPKGFVVSTSIDGENFKEIKKHEVSRDHREGSEMMYFDLLFDQIKCRYIKVEIKSMLKNPDWHPSPGGDSWFFIDEILVN